MFREVEAVILAHLLIQHIWKENSGVRQDFLMHITPKYKKP